jgi:hypothetical protein
MIDPIQIQNELYDPSSGLAHRISGVYYSGNSRVGQTQGQRGREKWIVHIFARLA